MSEARIQRLREVGVDVSRETWADLEAFMTLFSRWAARINLAAPSTLDDLFERHVVDSAQVLPLGGAALRWLDLGSGGGFPGAVLAILLKQRPGASIDLVESSHKKAAFLTTALGQARAPARVHAIRIEAAAGLQPEIVTARALAPLDELLGLARPFLTAGARGLFHKGRDYRREIAESPRAADHDLLAHASAVDPGSVILDVRRRPEGIRPAGPLLDRPSP